MDKLEWLSADVIGYRFFEFIVSFLSPPLPSLSLSLSVSPLVLYITFLVLEL